LREQINDVREFHEHMKIETGHPWPEKTNANLISIATDLLCLSTDLMDEYKRTKDVRFLRMHLIVEESGELCESLARTNKVETLDALADLCYVVFGTAAVYDLPLPEAFEEVHRSNMTKRPSDQRCSDKTGFVPPNLEALL
jgi:predicted HAD superfamily Cof-like phosphohydrolase